MRFLREFEVKNKRVLARMDFNVYIDKKTDAIKDDFRLRMSLPTLQYLLENKAKIILMAHLGDPGGEVREDLSLATIQKRLSDYLGVKIIQAPDCLGKSVENLVSKMAASEIVLLENLRFHKEEKENDRQFAQALAKLGELYINDAFGVCHRRHASVAAITEFLPAAAGLLLEKEIKNLSYILENPVRPLTVVIGGAKISTKIKFIEEFLRKADNVILGGALANTVLHRQGIAVGKSLIDEESLPALGKLDLTNVKLHMPVDVAVATDASGKSGARIAPVGKTGGDELILDIGPDTVKLFGEIIKKSKTIIWNGPMGLLEVEIFSRGTREIARAIIANREIFSVIGGGETIAILEEMRLVDAFTHISTGGGAMLAFLAGEKLPGLEALEKAAR